MDAPFLTISEAAADDMEGVDADADEDVEDAADENREVPILHAILRGSCFGALDEKENVAAVPVFGRGGEEATLAALTSEAAAAARFSVNCCSS